MHTATTLLLLALLSGIGTVFLLQSHWQPVLSSQRQTLLFAQPAAVRDALVDRELTIRKLGSLRAFVSSVYKRLIPPEAPVALVSLPAHWNLGDSFIWQGEKTVLDSLGISLTYACTFSQCESPSELERLAKAVQNGTILIHGGGNYGDLWLGPTKYISMLIDRFPFNRIIQLPQSVFYLNAAQGISDLRHHFSHPDFHLMVRDRSSFEFVRRALGNADASLRSNDSAISRLVLCPDSAIAIGPLLPNCDPDVDVVYLSRQDKEKAFDESTVISGLTGHNLSFVVLDWMAHWRKSFPSPENAVRVPLSQAELPQFRVHAANNMLCRGRVVVTDRLHAAIIGILIGRPVIALDNTYGKISNVVQCMFSSRDFGAPLALDKAMLVLAENEKTAVLEASTANSASRRSVIG